MKTIKLILFYLAILIMGSYSATGFSSIEKNKLQFIKKQLERLEASFNGRIGIYAIDTGNNQKIEYRASERFPIQSTFKVIAVAAILNKSASDTHLLQQKINYKKEDLVFWSPIAEKNSRTGMTISELCAAAIMYSDNTATNLIMKKLGGSTTVTAFARSMGDNTFRLDHWEPELNSDPNNLHDTSTPKAMGDSLKNLILGTVLASSYREQLVTWMKGNTTGDTKIRAGVPKGWIVADKTGSGDSYGVSNDIAIIWPPNCAPIVLVIYTVQNKKEAIHHDDIVAVAARIVISGFSQENACISKAN